MNVEIEAKLKVDSISEVAGRLKDVGAEFVHQVLQTDCFFDDAAGSLKESDSCLRLRRELIGSAEQAILTFKGPRSKTSLKTRKEIEISLQDGNIAARLLEALKFEKKLVIQKRRQVWRLMDCEVVLDELPMLGRFVEIEGPDERQIAQVQDEIGLAGACHIPQSYAALIEEELSRRGIKKREVVF